MKLTTMGLSIGAGTETLLASINLEVQAGQTLAILGPNGSGKSTLIRTMARQLKPHSGKIFLEGTDIWSISPGAFARQVAYVSQSQVFPEHLTILDYTRLGRNPHQTWWQWDQSENDRSLVRKALEATSLWELRERRLATLSGGERQRASVAIALAQDPKFILLDEPTAHLDFCHQQELLQLLLHLKTNTGLAIIIVLHDLNAAHRLADRVLLLSKSTSARSEIASYGNADDILQVDTLQAVFNVRFAQLADRSGEKYFVSKANLDEVAGID